MAQRIQHRRGTAAQWAAANPTLAMGEWGYETDTGRVKIGDAATAWSLLPFAVDSGVEVQADPLRQFSSALAKASTSPVTVVVVGDSLSEDWQWVDGAVVTPDAAGLRSWVRLFEVDLAERFHGGAVGVGWVPIRAGLGTNPGWDTVTGAAITTAGLGFYAVELEAAEYAEHTEVCDGVDLYIDSVASTLTIHIDAVLVDTLTADADPQVWSSGALTAGSHTVKVTAVGGTAKVYGSYWYLGNRASGIQVHNGGHSGAGPLDHSTTRGTLEHIALVQPDLVIVPIGAAANNAPTVLGGGFDDGVADYSTNITALLDDIAAEAPLASIVHVAEHAFTGRAATWPPFAVASRALAAAGGYGFADCYAAIGYTGGDPYDLAIFDDVHLNGRGHRVMADTILAAVVGSTTRLDGAVLSAPPGDTADVWLASGTGPRARLASILGTVGWYLRRAADGTERGVFSDTGVAWGDGTNAVDAVIQRISAGLLAVTGAFRFTEQSAPSSPSANTLVVYAADNGSGTTVLRTKDSAGTVTTLGAGGGGGITAEDALDAVGTALVAGEGIDITVNDGADTITIDAEAASATNAGIIEIATDAEVETGTDTARAITPAGLAALTATQSRKGIVEFATDLETQTGISTSLAVTPGGLALTTALTTRAGVVELATAAEVLTGTDTARAPTPSVIAPFAAHTRVSSALAETVPRHLPANATTLISGRLHLVAISLPAGLTITSVTFVSGAGLTGLSNQWFGLFDSSRVPLRLTGDDTSTAWGVNTAKTLNLSSTYATTTAGLYYLGICVVASGMGTIAAQLSTSIMTSFAPVISGASSTGLTNPASCPNPAWALAGTATIPFAYVS